jgi:Pentapeptide repeats (8 copies)
VEYLDYIVIGAIVAGLITFGMVILPRMTIHNLPASRLAQVPEGEKRISLENDRLKLRNEFRTACTQLLGGLGIIAGVIVTFNQIQESQKTVLASLDTSSRQLEIAERAALRQEYGDTLTRLGDAASEIRVAAISELAQFASENPTYRERVAELLGAYVRLHSPWPPPSSHPYSADVDLASIPFLYYRAPDVHSAVWELGRGKLAESTRATFSGDLRNTNFGAGEYREAYFNDAYLAGSLLERADLRDARFREADLTGAYLGGALLCGADLEDAILDDAQLETAIADDETLWPPGFGEEARGVVQAANPTECTE